MQNHLPSGYDIPAYMVVSGAAARCADRRLGMTARQCRTQRHQRWLRDHAAVVAATELVRYATHSGLTCRWREDELAALFYRGYRSAPR